MFKLFFIVTTVLLFNTSHASFYRVLEPVEFSKTFRVLNTERTITIEKKGSKTLTLYDSKFNELLDIPLDDEVLLDSVTLALDGYNDELLFLLFDCLESAEVNVVVELKENKVMEVRDEECKG